MGNQSSKSNVENRPCSTCDGAEVYRPNLCYDPSLCRTSTHPCYACNKLEAVEAQIQDSLTALRKLAVEHQKIKTELNFSHSRIINKIPLEIMSRIFQFCTPALAMDAGILRFLPSTDILAPLKLGAVCKDWRQIAWSAPEIWTYLSISLHEDHHPKHRRLIQEWIYRSKALPLTFSLSQFEFLTGRKKTGDDLSLYYPFLEELARSSNRWSSVHIDMQTSLMKVLYDNCRDVSLIRDLSLISISSTEVDEGIGPLWATEPEPESISIGGLLPVQVNVKWNSITSLTVSGWMTSECIEVIRNAPMLVICDLRATRLAPHISPLRPDRPITHGNIRTLHFEGTIKREYFFATVALPNLKNFRYKFYVEHGGDYSCSQNDVAAFRGFVTRSGSQLQSLKIDGLPLTYNELFDLLQAVPSLFDLYLSPKSNRDGFESFTEILIHLGKTQKVPILSSGDDHGENSSSAQFFLPHLRSFRCRLTVVIEFPWILVPNVFGPPSEFGKPHRRPLRTFHVYDNLTEIGPKTIPYDVLLQIRDLNDAGAKISYTGSGSIDLLGQALDRLAAGLIPRVCLKFNSHSLVAISC